MGIVVKKLYKELDVNEDVTSKEIEAAYRKKAMQHHPDRANGNTKRFKAAADAYRILIDPVKRKRYDEAGDEGFEEEPVRSVESILIHFFEEAIGQCIGQEIDPEHFDLINTMRLSIEKAEISVRKAEREGLKQLAILKKVDKKLKTKGNSIIKSSLKHHMTEIQRVCDKAREQLVELEQVKLMVSDYSYDFTEIPRKGAKWTSMMDYSSLKEAMSNFKFEVK